MRLPRNFAELHEKRSAEMQQRARDQWEHSYKRREEIRAWITLGIATAAFILSIISLVLQFTSAT